MENENIKVSPDEEVIKEDSVEETVDVEVNDEVNDEAIESENESSDSVKETVDSENSKETISDKSSEEQSETKRVKKEKRNKLKDENLKLKEENKKLSEKYLKAYAEMENSKKRINQQYVIDRKYSSQKIVGDLIAPVDMLTKATEYGASTKEMENFLMGFKMIASQITAVLEGEGLKEIDANGKTFDPTFHHAVSKEHVDGVEPNIIIEVQQSGYMYKDRVLKPAMVKVSE